MPLLHNYYKSDYRAALQNWDLAQGENGEIYIANGKGLLRYDGNLWSLTALPSNAIARSVLVDGGRVYVGAYKEFGYFERD